MFSARRRPGTEEFPQLASCGSNARHCQSPFIVQKERPGCTQTGVWQCFRCSKRATSAHIPRSPNSAPHHFHAKARLACIPRGPAARKPGFGNVFGPPAARDRRVSPAPEFCPITFLLQIPLYLTSSNTPRRYTSMNTASTDPSTIATVFATPFARQSPRLTFTCSGQNKRTPCLLVTSSTRCDA